jgi:hypothetical protein
MAEVQSERLQSFQRDGGMAIELKKCTERCEIALGVMRGLDHPVGMAPA